MKKIIFCEGKIDAILISLFLEKFGWNYFELPLNQNPRINIEQSPKYNKDNEEFNWYRHPEKQDQELAIWGVGGYNNLKPKLRFITGFIQKEQESKNRFNTIVLFADNDTGDSEQRLADMEAWIRESEIILSDKLQFNQWSKAEIDFPRNRLQYPIKLLPIILPPDGEGDLEIFLLNALKENERKPDDKFLVEEAEKFINTIPDKPYLIKTRLRRKAWLGSVLSVMFPDGSLKDRNRRLKQVNWEDLENVLNVYSILKDL